MSRNGRPGTAREKIIEAAQAASADRFIRSLPQGYDTVLGERGARRFQEANASASRLRALLQDAPVLILDELASELDSETESLILEALERLMEGRTTIVIAHRLSKARRADRVVVLARGEVVEVGAHEQLTHAGGVSQHSYNSQFGSARVVRESSQAANVQPHPPSSIPALAGERE